MRIFLLLIASLLFYSNPVKSGVVVDDVSAGVHINAIQKDINGLAVDHLYVVPTAHILHAGGKTDHNLPQRQFAPGRYCTFIGFESFLLIKTPGVFVERFSYCKKIGLKLIFPKHYFW